MFAVSLFSVVGIARVVRCFAAFLLCASVSCVSLFCRFCFISVVTLCFEDRFVYAFVLVSGVGLVLIEGRVRPIRCSFLCAFGCRPCFSLLWISSVAIFWRAIISLHTSCFSFLCAHAGPSVTAMGVCIRPASSRFRASQCFLLRFFGLSCS